MTEYWELIGILFAVGAFAGILAGLFGVGGGIVLVPTYLWIFSALGYANPKLMQIAVATSLSTIILTSIRSVYAHHRKGAVDWEILRNWVWPVVLGSIAAVFVARDLKSQILMIVFAVLAILIAFMMFFGVGRLQFADEMPRGLRKWVLGGMTGFFSTMMGIGGGSIAVPLLVTHGRPMHNAVATAAGFGAMIAVPSAITFMLLKPPAENLPPFQIGYVNFPGFLIVVIATMLTAPIGAKLAHGLDAKKLKRYFAVFILIVALNMIRKALSL